MTKAVVVYEPPASTLTLQAHRPPAAANTLGAILARAASGQLTPRKAKRLQDILRHAEGIAGSLEGIVDDCNRMTAATAACARDVAQCEADAEAFRAQAARSAVARLEAEIIKEHLPAVVKDEMEVRSLRAKVQAAELRERLTVLPPSAWAAGPAPVNRETTTPRPLAARVSDDDALHGRLSSEAAAILREVQGGLVPTDARHPFHAFAGCVYLRAKLDGQDASAAAAQACGELVAHMRDDREFTPGERKAFRREYDDLKKRLDGRTETRQGAALLAMMKHAGAASGPPNNGRGVQ